MHGRLVYRHNLTISHAELSFLTNLPCRVVVICSRRKKATRVAWIDIQRAFDKVWIDGLIVKLMRNGVDNNMLKWIHSYLFNR